MVALPQKPVANFSSNVTKGYAPLSVQFTDLSVNNATAWNWDFGDGTNSTQRNPTHIYFAAGNYSVAITATNAAGSNKTTKTNYIQVAEQLKIWELNASNVSSVPSGVYTASKLVEYPNTAGVSYNQSLKSIDYSKTYVDRGELYIGGLYPCTDCNLTIDLGIDRSWEGSDFELQTSVADIIVQRRGDNTYRITSLWTNEAGNQQSPMFDISPALITNNRIKLNLLSYNANRTNIIKFSDNLQMSTPYETILSRNLPYPVLIQPVIMCGMSILSPEGNSGWERVHIYNITQTIDRQTVTAYSTKNQTGFGLDAPVPSKDTNGTTYMQGKGQVGTVWADVYFVDPATVTYQKMLLSRGWELGIYFSQELANLPLQQAQALMDSEYSNISSTFGQPPTSFCCLRNNDNISHAIYAYQQ